MTDAQIEAIARAYCVKLGLDPDENIHPVLTVKRWERLADKVRDHFALQEAIAEVLGEKGVG